MTEADPNARPALAPGVRLQTDRATGRPVLLFPEGFAELDATGYSILKLCDGLNDIDAIAALLAQEYDVEPAVLRNDLIDFLAELRLGNLLIFQT